MPNLNTGPWSNQHRARGSWSKPMGRSDQLENGGGGGNDGSMEARVAKLESDMGHVVRTLDEMKLDYRELRTHQRSDFRLLFGALITVAVSLAGLVAHGFHWI